MKFPKTPDHMTLAKVVRALDALASEVPGYTVPLGRPMSYRGYYEDLAVPTVGEDAPTVAEFRDVMCDAIGSTREGYKGGRYTMGEDTPVWVAEWGELGEALVGFAVDDDDEMVRPVTEEA